MGENTMTGQFGSEPKTVAYAKLLVQANELRARRDYQAALAFYLKALEQWGENVELLAAVAYCYFALAAYNPRESGQNYAEAIAWMQKAVALAPDNAWLHANLAQFYQLGILDYEQAAREFRTAVRLAPYDALILFNAASLYGLPESVVLLEEAINWLEHAVQLAPDEPNYHVRLGQLYHEAGRTADAERECLRALLCSQPLDSGAVQTIKRVLNLDDIGGNNDEDL